MKITKQEALNLYNGLQGVSNLSGAKWAYAIAKNIAMLKPEIDALQKAYTAKNEFIEYERARLELAEKYSVKKDGKPETVNVGGIEEYLIADKDKFNQEFAKLQAKYKKAIDERKKQISDFNEILKEEVNIDFYTISPDYIPEEITPAQLSAIMAVVGDEKEKA